MSDGDQDVAVCVVDPPPSSRLAPPPLCENNALKSQPRTVSLSTTEPVYPDCESHTVQREVRVDEAAPQRYSELVNSAKKIVSDDCEQFRNQSSDDTVQNSASENELILSTSSEENRDICGISRMGNQSGKKKKDSDEDTPDETKTKCCEIPKKKLKDRNSKVSKSSRSDENDFEEDEVYPFDIRTRNSEHDDNDTVELEPFEIVETDDIKFIPGAGTSEVIRNACELKFKAIPEEVGLDDADELRLFEEDEETILKEIDSPIDQGDRILESGTTTAHSTFEFRQVKTKGKLKSLREESQSQTVYENVDVVQTKDQIKTSKTEINRQTSQSSTSSKSSSGSSSKSSSRQNSKEPINKPARNNKKKKDTESKPVSYENTDIQENLTKQNELTRLPETPKTTKAVILTQTMFSKPKTTLDKTETRKASLDSQNTYENVNLCAILTPTGIVIGHKKPDTSVAAGNLIHATVDKKVTGEIASAAFNNSEPINYGDTLIIKDTRQSSQVESAIYETIKSDSGDDKQWNDKSKSSIESHKTESHLQQANNKENCPLPEIPQKEKVKSHDKNVLQVEGREESVPPPSPQGMEILEEEEEDEDDEDEEEEDIDINRKSAEISDFTENVCKRLSQLLESMSNDDEQDKDEDDQRYRRNHSIHIYEEVNDEFGQNTERKEVFIETETPEMISSVTRLDPFESLPRNDSASTLKRTSGDSNTYPLTEFLGSSDDDGLPEYFDPRSITNEDERKTSTTKQEHASKVKQTTQRDDYVDMTLGSLKAEEDAQTSKPTQSLQPLNLSQPTGRVTDLQDTTPTAEEATQELSALPEYANVEEESSLQYHSYSRRSVTYTESDLDISEHRDDLSTDSMLADDEDEETMEILFTKTYTEPEDGGEVFLSCTVVNSAYKEERKKSETWLSDDALQYFEANAAEVMSTAFMKAKKEMKDIQICIQNLRHQMEHFHGDCDDVSLPGVSMGSLSPDYFTRKAVTD